jgi:serine/threonine protein kinase
MAGNATHSVQPRGGFASRALTEANGASHAPRGTVTSSVRGTDFTVDSRYSVQKFVGCGSYGVVCAAVDTRDPAQGLVAIKKIGNVFKNETTAKRTLREIKLLLHLDHENVIGIRDLMCGSADCADLYVVTHLMDTDLHKVIRSPQPLSDQHVQYFLYQLLRGLKYIHSCNVLHRDLKPSNLLVNENCDLKITDFGLSRGVNPSDCLDFLTEYVVTRWYRAPEIVLSSDTYTKAVDMWSVGCIFAELLGRKPLFPGTDHVNQLATIIDVIGTPHVDRELRHVPEKARRYIAGLPHSPGKPLRSLYPAASEQALQLLGGMLHWDPSQRCTVAQALSHPYLAAFHNPDAEPVATAPFDFASDSCPPTDAHDALFREVCRFRPELERQRVHMRAAASEQKAKRSRQPSLDGAAGVISGTAVGPRPAAVGPTAYAAGHHRPRYGERSGVGGAGRAVAPSSHRTRPLH